MCRPSAYRPIWKAHMCRALWGPLWFWLAEGWVNKTAVLELPPALVSTVLASSNMKWADASLGWFGRLGQVPRLPFMRLGGGGFCGGGAAGGAEPPRALPPGTCSPEDPGARKREVAGDAEDRLGGGLSEGSTHMLETQRKTETGVTFVTTLHRSRTKEWQRGVSRLRCNFPAFENASTS